MNDLLFWSLFILGCLGSALIFHIGYVMLLRKYQHERFPGKHSDWIKTMKVLRLLPLIPLGYIISFIYIAVFPAIIILYVGYLCCKPLLQKIPLPHKVSEALCYLKQKILWLKQFLYSWFIRYFGQ